MKDPTEPNAHTNSAAAAQNGYHANGSASNGSNGFAESASPKPSTSKAHDPLALSPTLLVDRTEFVKLALQTLRAAGYSQTAATLASESGVGAEPASISEFRNAVLQGDWSNVTQLLTQIHPDYAAQETPINFLIARQRYLELLERKQTRRALLTLRSELAPLCKDADQLHKLSSLMMCTDLGDLTIRAGWLGIENGARQALLQDLQALLPSDIMLPENRLATLLTQARSHQESTCQYHASDSSKLFPLLVDHTCSKDAFPSVNVRVLRRHSDEIWVVAFSHDGRWLATAGKDSEILIWDVYNDFEEVGSYEGPKGGVTCLAWSPDDSCLLSGGEYVIIWNFKTRAITRQLMEHQHEVTAIAWALDGSGFVTAGMDSKFFFRDPTGDVVCTWKTGPYRIMDAAITSDGRKMVAVGRAEIAAAPNSNTQHSLSASSSSSSETIAFRTMPPTRSEWRLQIYDLTERKQISSVIMSRDSTCVTLSKDSKYAIVNSSPNEIRLYSIEEARLLRRFSGHKQASQLIKNCFGGPDENFIITGSEDGAVYVWNRETGQLVTTLEGHEYGTVSAVAWSSSQGSPMLASVGDDRTVRIWAPPPSTHTP